MPSPIFLLNPPTGFGFLALFRGVQLAILGLSQGLLSTQVKAHFAVSSLIPQIGTSVLLQVLVWSPIWAVRALRALLQQVWGQPLAWANIVVDLVYHLQINVLYAEVFVLTAFWRNKQQTDTVFVDTINHSLAQSASEYRSLTELPLVQHGSINDPEAPLDKLTTLKLFWRYYKRHASRMAIALAALAAHALGSQVLMLSLFFYQFNGRLGVPRTFTGLCVLLLLPQVVAMHTIALAQASLVFAEEVLGPYFARVDMTSRERSQWMKSREGILMGFGVCLVLGSRNIACTHVASYLLALVSAAYLITQVSDPPPPANKVMSWIPTQLVWSRQQDVLDGIFE